MSQRTAFLTAIIANPDNDTARLVYADWLQEHGEEDRAEFIRVQCELAGAAGRMLCSNPDNHGYCDCRSRLLSTRQCELLVSRGLGWLPRPLMDMESNSAGDACLWSRGFVSSVTCTAADWLAHAEKLHWHPTQTIVEPLSYEERRDYACEVCGNAPDEQGCIEHGKGCYTQSEDGGGDSWVELPIRTVPRPCPETAQPITKVTLTTTPDTGWIIGQIADGLGASPVDGEAYADHAEMTLAALRGYSPGVEFELPLPESHEGFTQRPPRHCRCTAPMT